MRRFGTIKRNRLLSNFENDQSTLPIETTDVIDETVDDAVVSTLDKNVEKIEILSDALQEHSDTADEVQDTMENNEKEYTDGTAPSEEEIAANQEALNNRLLNLGIEIPKSLHVNNEALHKNKYQVLRTNNEGLGEIFSKIGEGLKKIWEAIKRFFVKIWKWFKSFLPTKRNKLIKVKKKLEELGVSKIHDDEQEAFEDFCDDKYNALLAMSNSSVSAMKTIVSDIVKNADNNVEALNTYKEALELIFKDTQVLIDSTNGVLGVDEKDNTKGIIKGSLTDEKNCMLKTFGSMLTLQNSFTNLKLGDLKNNSDVKDVFTDADTIVDVVAVSVRPDGDNVNVGCVCKYGANEINDDTSEKIYAFSNITLEVKTTGLKKPKLSKSDALSLIKDYLDNLTKIEKINDNLQGKLDKVITKMEKIVDKFELDKDTTNKDALDRALEIYKRYIRQIITVLQRVTADIVVSYSTTLNVIYDFGVEYACYVGKGIRHTEQEKRDEK